MPRQWREQFSSAAGRGEDRTWDSWVDTWRGHPRKADSSRPYWHHGPSRHPYPTLALGALERSRSQPRLEGWPPCPHQETSTDLSLKWMILHLIIRQHVDCRVLLTLGLCDFIFSSIILQNQSFLNKCFKNRMTEFHIKKWFFSSLLQRKCPKTSTWQ